MGASAVRGPLAQLAEQVTLNHPVPGSTPGRLTNNIENGGELRSSEARLAEGKCRNW